MIAPEFFIEGPAPPRSQPISPTGRRQRRRLLSLLRDTSADHLEVIDALRDERARMSVMLLEAPADSELFTRILDEVSVYHDVEAALRGDEPVPPLEKWRLRTPPPKRRLFGPGPVLRATERWANSKRRTRAYLAQLALYGRRRTRGANALACQHRPVPRRHRPTPRLNGCLTSGVDPPPGGDAPHSSADLDPPSSRSCAVLVAPGPGGWLEAVERTGTLIVSESQRKANECARRTGYGAVGLPSVYLRDQDHQDLQRAIDLLGSRLKRVLLAPDFADLVDGAENHDQVRAAVLSKWGKIRSLVPAGVEVSCLAWDHELGKGVDKDGGGWR